MGVVVNAMPWLLYLRERHSNHCRGGWVGPRAGLDWCGKPPPMGFEPWTVQPIASCYTSNLVKSTNYNVPPIMLSFLAFETNIPISTVFNLKDRLSVHTYRDR